MTRTLASTTSRTGTKAFVPSILAPARGGVLQRKCDCGQHTGGGACEECQKKKSDEKSSRDPLLQRSISHTDAAGRRDINHGSNRVPSIVHEVLRAPGQPLDFATRTFFEPRFGEDFSHIRIHDGQRADASAQAVGAAAYAVGQNLVFARGKYAPASASGMKLLAHELTHTVQQNASQGRSTGAAESLRVGPADDAFEQEASRNEGMVETESQRGDAGELNSRGQRFSEAPKRVLAPRIQRDLDDPSRFSAIHDALFVSTPGGGAPQPWRNPGPGEIGTAARIIDQFKTRLKDFIAKHPMSTGGTIDANTSKDSADADIVAANKVLRARFPKITAQISEQQLKDVVSIISEQQTSDPDFLKQWLTNRLSNLTDIDNFAVPEKDPRFQDILTALLADSEVGGSIRILASRIGAFTEGEGTARKVSLHKGLNEKQRRGTLLHELVHFYVHPTFKDWINKSTAPRFYDEGFTEYLSRLAMTPEQLTDAKGYQDRFDAIKTDVAMNASDEDIARAYFNGEVWLLEGKTDVSTKALEDETGLKSQVTPKEERDESKSSAGIAETVAPGSHYRFMNLGNEDAQPKREHQALFAEIQSKYLNGHPDVACRFVGHASSPGTDAFNLALSLKRAQAFYQMARDAGVPDSQLSDADIPQHFGERKPTAPNDDVRGRAFNRRVEMFLVPSQPSTGAVRDESKKIKSGETGSPEPLLQRSAVNLSAAREIPPIVDDVLRSPGQPLDTGTRAFFEPRFGRDFSHVRVHLDPRAACSARAVNAHAYTVGQQIVFGERQYAPASVAGRRLLAHELTHTVQQARGVTANSGSLQSARLDQPNDPLEREAQRIASEITKATSQQVRLASQKPTIHRQSIPTGISLKESKSFGHADLKEESDKAKFLTCIGAVTLLQLTPPGDYTPGLKTGDCTKEHLTPIANTCPEHDFCKDSADPGNKSPHEKCLEVGGSGSSGDSFTNTYVNRGPDTFVDRHVTRFPTSFLGDRDKKTCSVVCHQRYAYRTGADNKEHDLGSFYIIRNFRKDSYKNSESKQALTISTGEIKKVPADLAAPSKEKFTKDVAPSLVKSGSLLDAPAVPGGSKP